MTNRSRTRRALWRWFVPVLPLVTLTSCLVFVSTSPTTISGATIVFVAVDDRGAAVPSLQISVIDVVGGWRADGFTTRDGLFECGVRLGVTRVRADIIVPAGYVLLATESWPRHFDLSSHGTVRIQIHLKGV